MPSSNGTTRKDSASELNGSSTDGHTVNGAGHGRLGGTKNHHPSSAEPARSFNGVKRKVIPALVALGSVALALAGVRWAAYRHGNVVTTDATSKGYITYVGARVHGKVATILVEDNQPVKQGQVIARLEDQAFRAAVAQAKSTLNRAIKLVESTRLGIDYDRRRLTIHVTNAEAALAAAEGEIESAKAMSLLGQQNYDIAMRLWNKKGPKSGIRFTPLAEVYLRTAERDSTQAALKVANSHRDVAQTDLQTSQVELGAIESRVAGLKVLEAEIEVDRSALAAAEANLDATNIRAPDDGWVVRRIVDRGGSVRVGYPIFAIRVGKVTWVEAWVDESDLGKIRVGSPAEVCFKAMPGRTFTGKVEAIGTLTNTELQGAVVPPTLGQFLRPPTMVDVRIALDLGGEGLVPGLTAVVGIRKNSDGPRLWHEGDLSESTQASERTSHGVLTDEVDRTPADVRPDVRRGPRSSGPVGPSGPDEHGVTAVGQP